MSFYRHRILPWFAERILSLPGIEEQRRPVVRQARGRVLEIGIGFAATIPLYRSGTEGVVFLVGLEPNPGFLHRALRRAGSPSFPIRLVRAFAEGMPFADRSFDTVVSNWTLCTIPDPASALREVRRVLRPGGRFLFLEHGRAEEPRLARWQRRLNPIQRLVAGGCRLDTPIDRLIREAGFAIETLERYVGRPGPRVMTQMYRGVARST